MKILLFNQDMISGSNLKQISLGSRSSINSLQYSKCQKKMKSPPISISTAGQVSYGIYPEALRIPMKCVGRSMLRDWHILVFWRIRGLKRRKSVNRKLCLKVIF